MAAKPAEAPQALLARLRMREADHLDWIGRKAMREAKRHNWGDAQREENVAAAIECGAIAVRFKDFSALLDAFETALNAAGQYAPRPAEEGVE